MRELSRLVAGAPRTSATVVWTLWGLLGPHLPFPQARAGGADELAWRPRECSVLAARRAADHFTPAG